MQDPGLDVVLVVSALVRAVAVVVVVGWLNPLRRIGPGMFGVVERLGRSHHTLEPGWHVVQPGGIDRVISVQKVVAVDLDLVVVTARGKRRSLDAHAGVVVRTEAKAAYAAADLERSVKRLLEVLLLAAMRVDDASDDDVFATVSAGVAADFETWGCALVRLGPPEVRERPRLESATSSPSGAPVASPGPSAGASRISRG